MNDFAIQKLLSGHKHFCALTPLHQERLAHLIAGCIQGNFVHREFFPTEYFGSYALPAKYLQGEFAKTRRNGYYLEVIDPYLKCVDESFRFSGGNLTQRNIS